MLKRTQALLLIILAFACVALLSVNEVWAGAPCETVREYAGLVKVTFDPETCDVTGVYFWVPVEDEAGGGHWDTTTATPHSGEICVCTVNPGAPTDTVCEDEFDANLNSPYVTVVCHPIKSAGPRASGCPIWSPAVYVSPSGDAYVRGR